CGLLQIGLRADRARDAAAGLQIVFRQMRAAVRQNNAEARALARRTRDADLAAMHRHELAHQRQADAAPLDAAAARTLDAMEALEQQRELVLVDADAGIADHELGGICAG